ncbi:nucleoside triphosphate pyrophosphohydrolase [Oligoflexaceae bacterium]|nr:nucleoside triphosphate pyrophosphohydrolase [Oligoflexaceae bacterium]
MNQEEKIKSSFFEFYNTVAKLRDPETGCPWDLKQTHRTLRKYMIEEAYEASAEMTSEESTDELCDELGDVLLQVVLNAQVAKDQNSFDITKVINQINAKMIRRHPHVFDENFEKKTADQVKKSWEEIKKSEKIEEADSYFSSVENIQPANLQADKIGRLASKIQFDWDNVHQVIEQLQSEIEELKIALSNSDSAAKNAEIENEMGDVLFTCAQVSRHLGLSPEVAAQHGNIKFLTRFKKLEELAGRRGVHIESASREQLEGFWKEAKRS